MLNCAHGAKKAAYGTSVSGCRYGIGVAAGRLGERLAPETPSCVTLSFVTSRFVVAAQAAIHDTSL
jgi:hypothetical protein